MLNEISELIEDVRRRDPLIDPEDATFFRGVTPEDIENFVQLLKQNLSQ